LTKRRPPTDERGDRGGLFLGLEGFQAKAFFTNSYEEASIYDFTVAR